MCKHNKNIALLVEKQRKISDDIYAILKSKQINIVSINNDKSKIIDKTFYIKDNYKGLTCRALTTYIYGYYCLYGKSTNEIIIDKNINAYIFTLLFMLPKNSLDTTLSINEQSNIYQLPVLLIQQRMLLFNNNSG